MGPLALYVLVFGVVPAAILLLYSFWRLSGYEIEHVLTFENYIEVWSNSVFRQVMARSVGIGLAATVIVVSIAYPIAYYLAFKARRHRELLLFLVLLSLFGNYLVRIYAWRSVLSTNGLIDTVATTLGLAHEHRSYVIYTWVGTLVVLANLYVPFAVLPIYSALLNIPQTLVAAARDLGARPWRAFMRVTLPLSLPGLAAAFTFVFLLASADFATPLLVGGVNGVMIGVTIQHQFEETLNWPLGSALAFCYALVLVVVLLVTVGTLRFALTRRRAR